MTAASAIILLVAAERLAELVWARRNTALLLQKGAVEHGASHYPAIVIVHAAWLAGLWLLGRNAAVEPLWLAVFAALQIARLWVLASLRGRWTTRILVLPGEPRVRSGPYRFFAHPNYLVVAGEILALPMAFGLTGFALIFSALNAGILLVRIRAENAALKA